MGKNRRGFTLVEMMVVVTIIGLLAILGLANFTTSQKRGRDGRRKADLETIRSGLELYRADNRVYPTTAYPWEGSLGAYLNPVPVDPKNVSPYIYTYSSDGATYTLCANRLEIEGTSYCVDNP